MEVPEFCYVCEDCGAWCVDELGTRLKPQMGLAVELSKKPERPCVCSVCQSLSAPIRHGRSALPPTDRA